MLQRNGSIQTKPHFVRIELSLLNVIVYLQHKTILIVIIFQENQMKTPTEPLKLTESFECSTHLTVSVSLINVLICNASPNM